MIEKRRRIRKVDLEQQGMREGERQIKKRMNEQGGKGRLRKEGKKNRRKVDSEDKGK